MSSRERNVRFFRWKWACVSKVTRFSTFHHKRKVSKQRATKEEYQRLKQMIPSIATYTRVSKVKLSPRKMTYCHHYK